MKSAVQFEQILELFSSSSERSTNEIFSFSPVDFFPFIRLISVKKMMHKAFSDFTGDTAPCSIELSKNEGTAFVFDASFSFSIPTGSKESSKSLHCKLETVVNILGPPLVMVVFFFSC